MADDVKNQGGAASQMDLNPPVVSGGHGKEVLVTGDAKSDREDAYVVEVPTSPETEKPELAGYVENVEKQVELPHPVVDDYTGQVLLSSANPKSAVVTLPMTEQQVTEGLHHQVWESARWLAEWCVRQIKLLHGKVKYRGQ